MKISKYSHDPSKYTKYSYESTKIPQNVELMCFVFSKIKDIFALYNKI
jgi:hypothetical protein